MLVYFKNSYVKNMRRLDLLRGADKDTASVFWLCFTQPASQKLKICRFFLPRDKGIQNGEVSFPEL